ncbi:hypothetical protein AUR64_02485 [Haloprofundus marisrubri]|uniref:Uncharacterized protein n=1 Tax=Haloprofundus marisrubri TaxID=1514971 RepID=A0A0W1R4F4_9EURY|nr:acyl-CoA thioester hydrolase/BAAT C-terminal domain-containing protein [Haloprofundus marisrubri]KTG07727.1 hypothetical protein AUR64_02485 [Haloprofundus marisrubri]
MSFDDIFSSTRRRELLLAVGSGSLLASAGCSSIGTGAEPAIGAPEECLLDEQLNLRISGLDAGTEVSLRAAYRPSSDAPLFRFSSRGQFESYATFEADENGAVDVTEMAPVGGTYDGVRPMGLIWSMRPREHISEANRAPELDEPSESGIVETVVTAFVDGDQVASTRIRRRADSPGIEQVEPPTDIVGRCYLPESDGPHPGVLVLHGGGDGTWMDREGKQLASHGFAAFVLRYTGPYGPIPTKPRRVPLEYFDSAIEWFTGLRAVSSDAIGTIGWSLGGQLSLLLGARRDDVGAVVCYNGPSYVMGFDSFGTSPWSVDGEPVPYIEVEFDAGQQRTTDGQQALHTTPAHETALAAADEKTRERTKISVERISGPVLYVAGGDDAVLPAAQSGREVVERLDSHDHPYDYKMLVYENAGHSVRFPYAPTQHRIVLGDRALGGTASGIARAEANSWPTVLSYLQDGLE